MDTNNAMESLAKQYIYDANKVTFFKLIKNEQDLEDDKGCFHPDMSHQIFGEKESVFGYKDLKIKLYYGASSLEMYINISYSHELDEKKFKGIKADDIMQKLQTILPTKYHLNVDKFSTALLKEEAFRPFGNLINSFTLNIENQKNTFEIYKVTDTSTFGFQDYLIRIESFSLWFIDAASFIDIDDEKWEFYLMYKKSTVCGITSYHFVGYSTCYLFYCYPDKYRPRISQMLILPPFQRLGLCTKLIQCIYNNYCSKPEVFDITAEDPSSNFQRVRDFIDCTNCLKLKEFQSPFIQENFTKVMVKAAREKYKINKHQARRVYEILQLKSINVDDETQFRNFRLAVKSRIHFLIKNSNRKKAMLDAFQVNEEEKYAFLEKSFQGDYMQYSQVVKRLEKYSIG